MKLSQEKIDKINNVALTIFVVSLLICGAFAIITDIWNILTSGFLHKIILNILITITVISLLVALITGFWATDEDKKRMKEVMKELREEESKKRRLIPSDERIKSPLKGLTPQQEDVIIDLLCNKISVVNGRLKTSELKHLLKALALDGNLDDSDKDRVIAWVEQKTEKQVDVRNLKYDYDAKISDKEVTKWGNKIRERFEIIEIS